MSIFRELTKYININYFFGGCMLLIQEWKMFLSLWKVTPSDCRFELVIELIFEPVKIRERFEEENKFQNKLQDHWK